MSTNLPTRRAANAVGAPLVKLAEAASREHQKAISKASDAVQHAVRSGEILARARDLCEAGEWSELLATHFSGSIRTAQKYMRLARHVRQLKAEGPIAALSSQNQAAKALTEILGGERQTTQNGGPKRKRRTRGASNEKAGELVGGVIRLLREIERNLSEFGPQVPVTRNAVDAVARRRAEAERFYEDFLKAVAGVDAEGVELELTAPEALNGGLDATA